MSGHTGSLRNSSNTSPVPSAAATEKTLFGNAAAKVNVMKLHELQGDFLARSAGKAC
eukprot:CAMPEP_0195099892 /NCGR_PEP_ID=MMETSP0448-20130528/60099_1 /TAXON_ID=66468 /ORGANISM="Heterocapsa triquestra, Strain CCMP 448" /LENGTH=56 /DNA_ID=CAMNT_0040134901 /DNA_START=85 /DNA_END=254 /DNA_ORIENTATION=+